MTAASSPTVPLWLFIVLAVLLAVVCFISGYFAGRGPR